MSAALALVLLVATTVPAPVEIGTVVYATGWPDGVLVERPAESSGDPDGNGDPGVTLQPGGYLEFMGETTGPAVDGAPIVVVFAAAFDRAEPGALSFELLRCEAGECSPLSATSIERSPWGAGGLGEIRAELPPVAVLPAVGVHLCLRVVNVGDQPMQVAFGTERHRASVWLPTGDTLAAPSVAIDSTSPDDRVPEDRRDLLAGTIGLAEPLPPFGLPGALGAAAMLMFAAVAGAVLALGWKPIRTRRPPAHPARR